MAFKSNKKYKALVAIWSPTGLIKKGTIYTGKQWKLVLMYDVDENNFNLIFKEVI